MKYSVQRIVALEKHCFFNMFDFFLIIITIFAQEVFFTVVFSKESCKIGGSFVPNLFLSQIGTKIFAKPLCDETN